MRTLLFTLLIITCAKLHMAADVVINSTNFPDANFREFIDDHYDYWDDDILTDQEIATVKNMNVQSRSISSLTGITYFTALEKLWCDDNNLTNLDLSGLNKLTFVYCCENNINGNAMTSFINSLVSYPSGSAKGTIYAVKNNNKEKNIVKNEQAAMAEAKGWLVCVYDEGRWMGFRGVFGDVNDDGVCNAADITAIYNWILNGDASMLIHGDQNLDNVLNAADVTKVYNLILGPSSE